MILLNKTLTPVRLRIALSVALLLLALAGTGVFAYGYDQLQSHAADAQEVALQAEESRTSLQNLIAQKKFLEENADTVKRASQLVADSKRYQYQDQIINDINQYATTAGLQISSITFSDPTTTGAKTTPAQAAPGTAAKTPAPAGIKSMTAAIAIKNPTDYNAMLNFINLIQQSLFRMQVSKVSLSKSADQATPDKIASDTFMIEVYVR